MTRTAALAVALALLAAGCGRLTNSPPTHRSAPTTAAAAPNPRGGAPFGGRSNILADGSFERGAGAWAAMFNSRIGRTAAARRFGRKSLIVAATSAAPYGVQQTGLVADPAVGDRYRLSLWLRSADRPKVITVSLQAPNFSKAGQRAQILGEQTKLVGRTWTHVVVGGTVHRPNRTSVAVYISVEHSVAAGDGFFVDGVILTGGPG